MNKKISRHDCKHLEFPEEIAQINIHCYYILYWLMNNKISSHDCKHLELFGELHI